MPQRTEKLPQFPVPFQVTNLRQAAQSWLKVLSHKICSRKSNPHPSGLKYFQTPQWWNVYTCIVWTTALSSHINHTNQERLLLSSLSVDATTKLVLCFTS